MLMVENSTDEYEMGGDEETRYIKVTNFTTRTSIGNKHSDVELKKNWVPKKVVNLNLE